MKTSYLSDLLLNSIVPIALGGFLYLAVDLSSAPGFIKNHLADGLWAYAFLSTLLIIWERQIPKSWLFIPFIVAVSFEALQYLHIINGTADVLDIATYFISFIISLLLNPFFKQFFATKTAL